MEAELKRLNQRALGGRLPRPDRLSNQTLAYPFEPELAWLAVRYARTPSRVLWDLIEVSAARLEPLHDRLFDALAARAWPWMKRDLGFSVETKHSTEFPAGPLQIRGAAKNALVEASASIGQPLRLDTEKPQLLFRVEADGATARLSIDLAGRSLHKRGQRTAVGEASLKETLAAQILLLARWNPREEGLLDPMAGAGTFLLEASASARGASIWPAATAPSTAAVPPFSELESAAPDLFPGTPPPMWAIEVHTPTFGALKENIRRAGLDEQVSALHSDFRDVPVDRLSSSSSLPLPETGLVVVNPPYGERLTKGRGRSQRGAEDEKSLQELYEDLRDWRERELGPGWRIALLGPGPELKRVFGPRPKLEKPMKNGPLSVSLLLYED